MKEDITEMKRMVEELEQHRHHLEQLIDERTEELKVTLKRIRLSEERFAFALDAANDGVWDWSLQTNQVYCNPAYFHMRAPVAHAAMQH